MAPDPAPTGHGDRRLREVTSFVRRGSRLTPRRQQAWDRLAPRYVLDLPRGERDTVPAPGQRLDPVEVFGRRAPLVVEIGSGLGENIAAAAARSPERDHLACEVYVPGIAQTLERLEKHERPGNLRMLPLDALRALPQLLAPGSVDELWIFFPDPWHKSKHHKRRLVGPLLRERIIPLLAPGAAVRIATDWAQYAAHMREVLDAEPRLENLAPTGAAPAGAPSDPVPEDMPARGWAPRFEGRVLTSFENKALRAGRLVWDLAYRRVGDDAPAQPAAPPESESETS